MKNILLTILTILITIIMVIVMKSGINIGSLHVLGFQEIADENQKLLDVIAQSKQKNNEYTDKLQTINSDSIKSYRVEYLWSRVGNHATKEGVKVKMEIASSSMGDSEYKDLKFTVNGNYLAITNFIYDLENDESLDFTIDGFDMKSDVASFTVKDVKIIQEEKSSMTSSQNSVDNSNNANNTNNTNTVSETEKQKTEQRTNAIVNAFSPNN